MGGRISFVKKHVCSVRCYILLLLDCGRQDCEFDFKPMRQRVMWRWRYGRLSIADCRLVWPSFHGVLEEPFLIRVFTTDPPRRSSKLCNPIGDDRLLRTHATLIHFGTAYNGQAHDFSGICRRDSTGRCWPSIQEPC